MDQKLFWGAIGLFIFQVFVLLSELGVIPYSFWEKSKVESLQPVIGEILSLNQQVRKKTLQSIIWETPKPSTQVKAYDSILTLERSSAQIALENDVQLNLTGNTLVVLKPTKSTDKNSFLIEFQKGFLNAKNSSTDLRLSNEKWNFVATTGSELSIYESGQDEFQIEIHKGEVELENSSNSIQQKLKIGERARISTNRIVEKQKIDLKKLSFVSPQRKYHRIYSHTFPATLDIQYQGPATHAIVQKIGDPALKIPIKSEQGKFEFPLDAGDWMVRLISKDFTSPTLSVQVLPAPRLVYIYPLPRSRVNANEESIYSWIPHPLTKSFSLQFSTTPDFVTGLVEQEGEIKSSSIKYQLQQMGLIYWRIQSKDNMSFPIPSFYSYPIYNVTDPLAPPKLKPVVPRAPAQKQDTSGFLNILENIHSWIVPKIYAESTENSQTRKTVVFSWFEVPEADFYIIEVSKTEDFLDPLLVQRIPSTEFEWSQFENSIYYYRVAAGQSSGRMGLFSDPQEVDLQQLNTIETSQELRPGVRVQIKKINEKIRRAQEGEMEKPSGPEQFPNRGIPNLHKPIALERRNIHVTGELFWSGGFVINSQKSSKSIEISQNGWTANRLGLHLTIPLSKSGHIRVFGTYRENQWSSGSDQPFQEDLKQQNTHYAIYYGAANSNTELGAFGEIQNVAERVGNESIRLRDIEIWGLTGRTSYDFFINWTTRHSIGLGYGEDYFLLKSNNSVLYHLNLWGPKTGNTGLEFNIVYGQGNSDKNFVNSEVMYRLGFAF